MADSSPSKQQNTVVLIEQDTEVEEPSLYHVVLLNDDYTPMDFVIDLLMSIFDKDYTQAYDITMQVHHQQRGIAGTYAYEIAKEKVNQVAMSAQANEFPLSCITEKV